MKDVSIFKMRLELIILVRHKKLSHFFLSAKIAHSVAFFVCLYASGGMLGNPLGLFPTSTTPWIRASCRDRRTLPR